MPSATLALLILGVTAVLAFAAYLGARGLTQAGKEAERAARAEADAAVTKKQAEIMVEQRSPDDAAARLDEGSF